MNNTYVFVFFVLFKFNLNKIFAYFSGKLCVVPKKNIFEKVLMDNVSWKEYTEK